MGLSRHRLDKALEREAGLLTHLDVLPDLLGRLIGLDLDARLQAQASPAHRSDQRRATHGEPRHLFHTDALDIQLGYFPVPGKLGEHSEGDGRAEVHQRRGSRILASQVCALVAHDGPRASFRSLKGNGRLLFHVLKGFCAQAHPQFPILALLQAARCIV